MAVNLTEIIYQIMWAMVTLHSINVETFEQNNPAVPGMKTREFNAMPFTNSSRFNSRLENMIVIRQNLPSGTFEWKNPFMSWDCVILEITD